MVRYAPLVYRNALRNRRRSLLTILSIAASFCLLGVLLAMYHLFFLQPQTNDQALRLIVRNRTSITNIIPRSYEQKIRTVAGVRDVMPFQWFGGTYKDERDMKNFFSRFGVDPDKLFTIYPEYHLSQEAIKAFQHERVACIVGRSLADRLGFKVGDRITLVGDIFPVTLQLNVRGIYDSDRDNENLFFHLAYLNESSKRMRDVISMFIILADNPASVPLVADAVDALFRNSASETKTETEKAFELSFLSYLGDVKSFLLAVCGALTFTVLLVSANTMAMSVRERVKEVGVMKTLGYQLGLILAMLLGEAVMLSIVGAAVGLGLAFGIVGFMHTLPSIFVDLKALHIPGWVLLVGLALAVVVGVASAFVPAWTTSRRPIIECLSVND